MDLFLGLLFLSGLISLSDQKISYSHRTKPSSWEHTVAVAYDIQRTGDTFTRREHGESREERSVEGDARTNAPQQWATTQSAAVITNFCPIEITPENQHLFEFNSTCFICSISDEFREIACPHDSNIIGEINRGCVIEKGVFSVEGCSFRCLPTRTHEEECCPGFWGTSCLGRWLALGAQRPDCWTLQNFIPFKWNHKRCKMHVRKLQMMHWHNYNLIYILDFWTSAS